MNPKSSKIYGKATCRRFWLVKAHHYRFSLRLFKRPSCSQCISSALVGYGTPDPQIVKKQHAQNREIQLVTNQDLPRKGQATESLGPSTGGWKYLSSNLKNTNYWIIPHWMTQVVLSFPTHSWKIKLLQSHTWGPPVTSIYYLLVLYGFVTSPYCQNTPRGCVLVCFGAFSKRKASAMKQPQLRSRPRDADCLVARMVALDQGQCFGPGTLHLRWQSQWTKMLRCGCGGWETLIDLNLSSNLWNNLSINLSSYIHIARIKFILSTSNDKGPKNEQIQYWTMVSRRVSKRREGILWSPARNGRQWNHLPHAPEVPDPNCPINHVFSPIYPQESSTLNLQLPRIVDCHMSASSLSCFSLTS